MCFRQVFLKRHISVKLSTQAKSLYHEKRNDPKKNLNTLPLYHSGVVDHVEALFPQDMIAKRLEELGFVPGEPVKVIAYCPLGKDPIAVEIGFTRFALRSSEARRVILR